MHCYENMGDGGKIQIPTTIKIRTNLTYQLISDFINEKLEKIAIKQIDGKQLDFNSILKSFFFLTLSQKHRTKSKD